jgi:hypothetical protein
MRWRSLAEVNAAAIRQLQDETGLIAGAALAGGMLGGLEMRQWWWVFDGAGLTLQVMA